MKNIAVKRRHGHSSSSHGRMFHLRGYCTNPSILPHFFFPKRLTLLFQMGLPYSIRQQILDWLERPR